MRVILFFLLALCFVRGEIYEIGDSGKFSNKFRYIVDKNGLILDLQTRLMWQDNAEIKKVKKDWQGANEYCENLVLGDYDDWRVPEVFELLSIVDARTFSPAIRPIFKNATNNMYWTSTQSADLGISVNFANGNQILAAKTVSTNVRCVRDRKFDDKIDDQEVQNTPFLLRR